MSTNCQRWHITSFGRLRGPPVSVFRKYKKKNFFNFSFPKTVISLCHFDLLHKNEWRAPHEFSYFKIILTLMVFLWGWIIYYYFCAKIRKYFYNNLPGFFHPISKKLLNIKNFYKIKWYNVVWQTRSTCSHGLKCVQFTSLIWQY